MKGSTREPRLCSQASSVLALQVASRAGFHYLLSVEVGVRTARWPFKVVENGWAQCLCSSEEKQKESYFAYTGKSPHVKFFICLHRILGLACSLLLGKSSRLLFPSYIKPWSSDKERWSVIAHFWSACWHFPGSQTQTVEFVVFHMRKLFLLSRHQSGKQKPSSCSPCFDFL